MVSASEGFDVAMIAGTVTPQNRAGKFLVKFSGSGIRETRTVEFAGQPPQVTVQMIGFGIDSQVDQDTPLTISVPFSVRYAADAVTQSHTVAGASPYNNADLATRIELGPFTAEYPPEERLGGR